MVFFYSWATVDENTCKENVRSFLELVPEELLQLKLSVLILTGRHMINSQILRRFLEKPNQADLQ